MSDRAPNPNPNPIPLDHQAQTAMKSRRAQQLGWFVLIWAASVLSLAVVAGGLRWWLHSGQG